jgi:hypothetical protein
MKENTSNPFINCGFSGTNPKSPANPQYEITVFSHLPEKVEYQTPLRNCFYTKHHYPPIYEEVHTILEVIRIEKFKSQIEALRILYDQDKNQYSEKKKELPIIMFNGRFSRFAKEGLISPSGLIVLDFDDIPSSDLITVWNELVRNEYVFSAWLSPSGHGYKVLVKLENNIDDTTHKEYFASLSTSPLFPIQYIDKTGSDISRCCFFSSDPDLYLNDNSKVWTQMITTPSSYATTTPTKNIAITLSDDETENIIKVLEGGWSKSFPMTTGNRHHSTFKRARELAEWGVPLDDALAYMLGFEDSDFKEDEIRRQVRNAYKKTEAAGKIGTKYRKL